ncbi:MAG: GH116 family glycosyl-hydrolase [Luteolibacter sp.]
MIQRRNFLKLGALTGAGLSFPLQHTMAADNPAEVLYAKFVPGDKNLSADWLASLTERGHKLDTAIQQSKSQGNLDVIGMTAGGIGCGTVYLAGDGRLWVWDIFNQHHEGVVPNNKAQSPEGLGNIGGRKPAERDGANFLLPPRAADHSNGVDARFVLSHTGKDFPLDASGWDEVNFTGRWPIGQVEYASQKTPLSVRLEAFSPFVPLDLKASSLPITVLEYTVSNSSEAPVEIALTGHLNNPAGQFSKREADRFTESFKNDSSTGLFHGLKGPQDALDAGSMVIAAMGSASADPERNTVSVPVTVPARGEVTIRFAIAWHFPNLSPQIGVKGVKRHYIKDFPDARAVLAHFAKERETLCDLTRKWTATWNDSTLPQWLLDRVILTTNTLQTQNCFIFDNGRFWAWEGVGCCPGTCGHVWEYSQGHARLFPEIERNLREVTDYSIAQNRDGSIRFRGSNDKISAIDSQTSYILRTLRDHQLSEDPDYLKRVWPATRKALQYLIDFDSKDPRGGLDGLLDGMQHNTLDAEWYGKVHVLCSMYLASLRAGEELALAAGDKDFAKIVREIYRKGAEGIATLFDGEFYEQIEDPEHLKAIGVSKGCYIDQVMGQFWANQVGLGRIYNAEHQKSALRALWKYNFVPEYGAFRKGFKEGRHYATAGDAGLLMCTWPKGGLRPDFKKHWQYAYFNEFMTGFEYQAAAHMIAERDADLVQHGLAITRAIHDRYSAGRGRNPYNEIECSDHYARAGASYGVFLALCGFEFDHASGRLAFDPVIGKDHFRTPFTTSQAWGTYEQKNGAASITITHGKLALNQLDLGLFKNRKPKATLHGKDVEIRGLQLREGDLLVLS